MTRRHIFLWGPSRSVSTAMQKAFQQRPDTQTLFEPFADTYYFSDDRYTTMYGDKPEVASKTFKVVCDEVMQTEADVVFMKEMAYFVSPYDFGSFLDQATNTFIIRDPKLTLASRKKERKDEIGEHEFGFTGLEVLWKYIRTQNPDVAPVVVDGERLRANPEKVLRKYCELVDLAFADDMLAWNAGPIREFEEYEAASHARWHKTLDNSTGFISDNRVGLELNMSELTPGEVDMLKRASVVYDQIVRYAI